MQTKITFLLIVLSLFLQASATAQATDPYPPSRVPDRVILTWSDDPATTQSVSWRTDVSVKYAWAEIALADPGSDFWKERDTVVAKTTLVTTNVNVVHLHSVTFTDLAPNTKYLYRVGNGRCFSEWFQFKTASDYPAPFSFLYFGDAQNQIRSMWSRCIRQAYSTMPDVAFLLHAGDLVDSANDDREWGEWFHAGGWIYGMRSNIATPGNHEYYRSTDDRLLLSNYWKPTFTLPENGPEELSETVYYLNYQGAKIISLNTQAARSNPIELKKQKAWLEKVLKENEQHWTVVMHHHPIYSTKFGRDNEELRKAFQPLYEKYGVDIVLQGHDHTYGRGHNLEFGNKKNRQDRGPVYVVSVSGPKMYDLSFDQWLERAASNTQLYQLIKIDDNVLYYQAYTTTGDLYDAFSLTKQSNGTNLFKDLAPELPSERLELPERLFKAMGEEEVTKFRMRLDSYKSRKAEQ